ncbi:MAG: glycosyltransferase family 4 protein [Thermoplasmatales archaeon]
MQRVLFVRGKMAPPWEAPVLRYLNDYGYDARFLVSNLNPEIEGSLQIRGKNLSSSSLLDRMLNRSTLAKILNYGLNVKTSEYTSRYLLPGKIILNSDILHLVDDIYSSSLQALNFTQTAVMTVWENIPYHFGIEYGRPTKRYREKAFAKIRKFLPVTLESQKYLMAYGIPEEKIEVIHPGIDVDLFSQAQPHSDLSRKIMDSGRNIILGVSRLEYFKGITITIRALQELKMERNDFLYVHVGTGSSKFRQYILEMSRKLGLEKNVLFPGSIPYSQIPDLYSVCDLFVLPSIPTLLWEEQLGFSLLEAMSAGKPVLASDLPAIREVVGNESGNLFPAGNYITLYEHISRLLNDVNLRKKMGENGKKRVATEFNARNTAQKYAKIYKSL